MLMLNAPVVPSNLHHTYERVSFVTSFQTNLLRNCPVCTNLLAPSTFLFSFGNNRSGNVSETISFLLLCVCCCSWILSLSLFVMLLVIRTGWSRLLVLLLMLVMLLMMVTVRGYRLLILCLPWSWILLVLCVWLYWLLLAGFGTPVSAGWVSNARLEVDTGSVVVKN